MESSSRIPKKEFNLFFSYNQKSSKQQVRSLYDKLKHNYKIWLDEENAVGGNLMDAIAYGITNSECIVCFITLDYANSEICKKEINLASSMKKPIVIIMLERINPDQMGKIGGVGLLINAYVRWNFFNQPNNQSIWSGELFEKLLLDINKKTSVAYDMTKNKVVLNTHDSSNSQVEHYHECCGHKTVRTENPKSEPVKMEIRPRQPQFEQTNPNLINHKAYELYQEFFEILNKIFEELEQKVNIAKDEAYQQYLFNSRNMNQHNNQKAYQHYLKVDQFYQHQLMQRHQLREQITNEAYHNYLILAQNPSNQMYQKYEEQILQRKHEFEKFELRVFQLFSA